MDQGLTPLQMMLIKQAGPKLLSLSNLLPDEFLRFVHQVEQMILDEKVTPIIVYSSSHDASRLLPSEQQYRQLRSDAFYFACFSENRRDGLDEWCFLVESQRLCLIVCGQINNNPEAAGRYQCVGSLDPQIVHQAFLKMIPVWQAINFEETNHLEDARNNLGVCATDSVLADFCRRNWPVIKLLSSETKVLQPQSIVDPITGLVRQPALPSVPNANEIALPILKSSMGDREDNKEEKVELLTLADIEDTNDEDGVSEAETKTEKVEIPSVIPPQAQTIIRDIVGQLRQSNDLSSILQLAIESLTNAASVDRGLIWQIVGNDQLAVTNEFAVSGHTPFVGNQLSNEESAAIVMDFLSRFPDETGASVISIPDTHKDTKLHKMSPTLSSLLELGDVRARLVAQLRSQGEVNGFLELQQCGKTKQWSEEDAAELQSVAEILSVVVAQSFHEAKIEIDAQEKKLINDIASLFRESSGQKGHDTLAKSVRLVADHMGFENAEIYLYIKEESVLLPQIAENGQQEVHILDKDNHFVTVFESRRGKIINAEYSRKGDKFFGHDSALVVPLVAEGETLGVLGLWKRAPNRAQLSEHDQNLALAIAGQLASFIRADQAIARIREDQAREVLYNRISDALREHWKDLSQMLNVFLQAIHEHFGLALSVVSLCDKHAQDFIKSQSVGGLGDYQNDSSNPLSPNLGEELILSCAEDLKAGKLTMLCQREISDKLTKSKQVAPNSAGSAALVPFIHGKMLKAALCMVANTPEFPLPEKDLKMVADLAERVAGAIAHNELFIEREMQAITDPMTGLYNRRHFQEQLSKELDRSSRYGKPFSYIIADLDFLKKINDTLGHQYGDAAIKHIANALKVTVRELDTAARYGGEEFVILLPETDTKAARIAAERICSAVREKEVEGIGTITCSVGVATYPVDAEDRDTLTELADQALYLAKHRGRNQVCSASEDLLPTLKARGEEALEIQKASIKAKAAEMASIDLKLIAEHGILGILGAIIKIIEARDSYSNERSPRAAEYASRLAHSLHLSKDHITIISLAAVLQNVGKIALPEDILKKKGPLTDEERKIVEQSPTIGAKILEPAKHLHAVASVIESYHECWDGTGYPKGLKGEDIPLESRIIALIDAYVAMTSDRPWRAALSKEEAVQTIKNEAGKKWDPRLVKLFLAVLQKESANVSSAVNSQS